MHKLKFLLIVLFFSFLSSKNVKADWQQTLDNNFDIAESFNNLQDWSANGLYPSGAGGTIPYDKNLLPKKMDGDSSRWDYWNNKAPTAIVQNINNGPFLEGETVTNDLGNNYEYRQTYIIDGITYLRFTGAIYGQSTGSFEVGQTLRGLTSGATATLTAWPKIIADHGQNKWGTSGKSLMMNLGDNDNNDGAMAGIGAQRLGMFFGDGATGKSGYKKIHVFMMVKFAPTFFGVSGQQTDIDYQAVFKFLDLCSGFTAIDKFGTQEEQANIEQSSPQTTTEYGANVSIVNIAGGGASNAGRVYMDENLSSADINHITEGSDPPRYFEVSDRKLTLKNNDSLFPSTGTDLNRANEGTSGDWLAIEIVSDIGTVDNSDGTTDLYVYDKNGQIKGHYSATGISKLGFFDHYYNKVTLGGNRKSTSTKTSLTDGRYWIDDFIIDDQRIGPKYFSLLNISSDSIAPSAPSLLSVQ